MAKSKPAPAKSKHVMAKSKSLSTDSKPIVYVVGNPLVPSDTMPLRLLSFLREALPSLDFQPFEPTRQDIPHNQDLTFIDTVQGLKEVCLLHGVESLMGPSGAYSLHDFDLAGQLLLMDKFGLLGHVHIIGVPSKGKIEIVGKGVVKQLRALKL